MSTIKISMVMVAVSLGCASADCISSFSQLNQTTEDCFGDTLRFECSTAGGSGSTVFQGDLLDCNDSSNEIVLAHSLFSNMPAATSKLCNGGKIRGYSLPINDSEPCYTSQLHVTVSPNMIGKSIMCVDDDGATTNEIGNFSIEQCRTTITTIAPSTESIWTGTAVYENNTKSSTTMYMHNNGTTMDTHNKAVKSLSSREAVAIVLCCSAIIVGIMITIIILLTHQLILKHKQLQVIQTPNSEYTTQGESPDMGQQSNTTFHCALEDEVSGYTLCTTDYECIAIATDDSEYSRLQHPGGKHAPHRMESREHLYN